MRFLLLNQTFYPDVASTAQHLSDLAIGLVERGHEVTVLTSRRAYDDPDKLFPKNETWRGIRIIRIGSTGFGKGAKWRRAADFASFLLLCALRLAFLPRHNAIVALTSPPLISFLGAWVAKIRKSRFFYWVMDFNPDEAIAAGWLRPDSFAARVLERMSVFSLQNATRIIALDRFMRDRIVAKNISPDKIVVLPPWPHDSEVRFDPEGRERFRKANGFDGKFVVMYSGNHSPCHPLDTLVAAAHRMSADPNIIFSFIGGGSEWRRINAELKSEKQSNIKCLPYQPLSELSGSLSAADLHVVVMGAQFVGIIHPCKIYNILTVGAPVLYIGPRPSHLSEILSSLNGEYLHASASNDDIDTVVQQIKVVRERAGKGNRNITKITNFSKETVLPELIHVLESG
jgi:colanic acid biosynthesis glycosyl transferase WcaI